MRKVIAGVLSVMAVAAAGYAGFHAWLAWGLPARPVSSYLPAKGCEHLRVAEPERVRAELRCRDRQHEAVILKGAPGLATRDGDSLTIFYRGRPTHHLVPVAHSGPQCGAVDVHRALALVDPATRQKEQIALVSCHYGEFEHRFIALPDGTRWTVADATASPDGQMVATGMNLGEGGTAFTILAWPSRQVIARFQPSCRVIDWTDPTHLTVTCIAFLPTADAERANDGTAFDARVWRDDKGVWRMQATRWLMGRSDYNDYGEPEYAPSFSLRWLPAYSASLR